MLSLGAMTYKTLTRKMRKATYKVSVNREEAKYVGKSETNVRGVCGIEVYDDSWDTQSNTGIPKKVPPVEGTWTRLEEEDDDIG